MGSEFNRARQQPDRLESHADVRCPDRRSSGAKRLTPQLQIKVPTLRLWGAKLTVAVDAPALRLARGPNLEPSKHLGDGDYHLARARPDRRQRGPASAGARALGIRYALTLEESSDGLHAAKIVSRCAYEGTLRGKLKPLN